MPLLGGLFHKRNTHSRHTSPGGPSTATESVASSTSNKDSTDGDYVLPDKSLPTPSPIYNLPAAASSSKLKLPFRRKAFALPRTNPKGIPHPAASPNDALSPYISSVTSDSGHGLPPPPRKSSLFAVHNESLQSVHSLPNESSSRIHPDTHSRLSSSDVCTESHSPAAAQAHKKSPALFSWARERTKSKPLPPTSTSLPVPSTGPSVDDSSSFNLKSFRHVGADPPITPPEKSPQSLSTSLLAPPRPRSRGDSVASDSSQRISVAAFREAQARTRANSPIPSFRPPSTVDTLRVDGNGRKRASTVSVVSGTGHPQPSKDAVAPTPSLRPESSALDTSSDDSGSEEDEEVDSDGEPVPKPDRKRTITRRVNGTRMPSNAEHNSVPSPIDQMSHTRQDHPKLSGTTPPLTYQTNQAPFTRQRASVSTSALTPNGAARRASILTAANSPSNSHAPSKHSLHKSKCDSNESTDCSDTDSEDMPLSDLVAPRRPGSSASNQSGSRPRMPAKPLIDIKSLAGGPPLLTPILRHEDSVRNFNMKGKEQDIEKDQPFSIPAVLALSSTSPPISPSTSKQNSDMPVNKPAFATHYRRSSSDVPAKGLADDEDLMNAIRLVGALDKDPDQPSGVPKPPVKSPFDRIVPTPIRKREPPTSFTVLSRPPQRQSIVETSGSLPLVSQTQFNVTPPALSSQPGIGARQRPLAVVDPVAQNDKSDAVSVSSAARSSTSRSSSRIPPVPLIHSIPDSPSVKEGYKPGRPRSASRISGVNSSGGRSQPPPTTFVSAVSSSTPSKAISRGSRPSLMPQRPFATNSSTRGESPAGSSTGDSSSGRAPFTPRDGSDIGMRSKDDASDVGSTLKARGHAKKPSVTFEDTQPVHGRERAKADLTNEQKTRERRRSEAKAAIELGKIVNGRGPLRDDSDSDVGPRGRNPAINVTMDNGVHGMMQPGWASWQQPMVSGMTPMVPPQFSNDPAYLAAHQRALFIAKQAYQMAVAQHAMQIAGEEWERSSNAGFGSGGSVYGGGSGGSVYGGGSGGSVYGGGSGGSVYGGMTGMAPMSMMAMPNMGMLMPPNQWARSSVAFPSAPSSVYGGISSSQSEFGGASGWGTRSVYGESFGSSSSRSNHVGNGVPNSAASGYGGGARPRASTGVSPSSTSSGQPTRATGKTPAKRAAPPSSWKNGR